MIDIFELLNNWCRQTFTVLAASVTTKIFQASCKFLHEKVERLKNTDLVIIDLVMKELGWTNDVKTSQYHPAFN